jgi:hypothetical protein
MGILLCPHFLKRFIDLKGRKIDSLTKIKKSGKFGLIPWRLFGEIQDIGISLMIYGEFAPKQKYSFPALFSGGSEIREGEELIL